MMKNTINISLRKNNISHSIVKKGGNWGTDSNVFNDFEKTHPWLKSDGSMKSDKEVSKLGQSWNAETWDNYLKATINHGDPDLLVEKSMDDIKAYIAKDFLSFLTTTESYEYLHAYVKEAISKKLSPQEEKIIVMKYFNNMSEREVSEEMNVSLETIKKYRKSALKKLKKFFNSIQAINEVKSLVLLRLLEDKVI